MSMTVRFHLFPFRTQKLSSLVPKIVGWRRPVKIGRCRLLLKNSLRAERKARPGDCLYAPLAQLVEQLTLNQWVLGSSPRWCTKVQPYGKRRAVFLLQFPGMLRIGAPSGTRTARAPRSAYRGAKTPRWGVFRARESPRGIEWEQRLDGGGKINNR